MSLKSQRLALNKAVTRTSKELLEIGTSINNAAWTVGFNPANMRAAYNRLTTEYERLDRAIKAVVNLLEGMGEDAIDALEGEAE